MDLLRHLDRFLFQWLSMLGLVLGLLAFNTLIGWGATMVALPRWFRMRWPVFAPLVGMALAIIVLTPFLYAGFPIRDVGPIFLLAVLLFNTIVLARLLLGRNAGRWRRSGFYARRRLPLFLAGLALVTLISTDLITNRGIGSISDVWGSGDIGTYSLIGDYLQDHGGTLGSYSSQSTFHSKCLRDTVTGYARQGSMGHLALISYVFSPRNTVKITNVYIVHQMLIYLLLSSCILERERVRAVWPLLIIAVHPFLYFLLYFTYLGQALGVLITMFALLVASAVLTAPVGRRRNPSQVVFAGMLLGAALLSYPLMLPGIFCYFSLLSGWLAWSKAGRVAWVTAGSCLLVTAATGGFYVPAIVREILDITRHNPGAGWTWRDFIGMHEVYGLSSVLGYDLPSDPLRSRIPSELLLLVLFGVSLTLGFRRVRDKLVWATLFAATLGTTVMAIRNHYRGIVNANHGYVKAISQFIIFFLLISLMPYASWIKNRGGKQKAILLLLGCVVLAWAAVEIQIDHRGAKWQAWYTTDLIKLVRRNQEHATRVCFIPTDLDVNLKDFVVQDSRKLLSTTPAEMLDAAGYPFKTRFFPWEDDAKLSKVQDRLGRYLAGQPPDELDLESASGRAWVVRGDSNLGRDQGCASQCLVILGSPSPRLEIQYLCTTGLVRHHSASADVRLRCEVFINERPCGVVEFLPGCGKHQVALPADASRRGDTYALVRIARLGPPGDGPSKGDSGVPPDSVIIKRLGFR